MSICSFCDEKEVKINNEHAFEHLPIRAVKPCGPIREVILKPEDVIHSAFL